MHMMKIELPVYAKPSAIAIAAVTYVLMYWKATRWRLNLYLFMLFTLALGVYLVVSVAGNGKHIMANLIFQFTMGWVLMLLYSLPSFCCNLSIFDIKYGWIGYVTMVAAASVLGTGAAMKMTPGPIIDSGMPVFIGAAYNFVALCSVYQAMGYFYEDLKMAIVIYPWIGPLDWMVRSGQLVMRHYLKPATTYS